MDSTSCPTPFTLCSGLTRASVAAQRRESTPTTGRARKMAGSNPIHANSGVPPKCPNGTGYRFSYRFLCVLRGFLRFLRFAFAWLAANIHHVEGIRKRKPRRTQKRAKNANGTVRWRRPGHDEKYAAKVRGTMTWRSRTIPRSGRGSRMTWMEGYRDVNVLKSAAMGSGPGTAWRLAAIMRIADAHG